mgnify:FL=1
MHWCRADLQRLHGGYGGDPFFAEQGGPGPRVIHPDVTPMIEMMPEELQRPRRPELVPTPEGEPVMQNGTRAPVETGVDRRVTADHSRNAAPLQATPWRPSGDPAVSRTAERYAVHPLPPVVGTERAASPNSTVPVGALVEYRDGDGRVQPQPVHPATYLEGK